MFREARITKQASRFVDTLVDVVDLARFSKLVFGNRHRLSVAGSISRLGRRSFFVREIASDLGVPDNIVRSEILKYEEAGLLKRIDRVSGQQIQRYEKVESVFWEFAALTLDEVSAQD